MYSEGIIHQWCVDCHKGSLFISTETSFKLGRSAVTSGGDPTLSASPELGLETFTCRVRDSIVVSISAWHAEEDPGSTPGLRVSQVMSKQPNYLIGGVSQAGALLPRDEFIARQIGEVPAEKGFDIGKKRVVRQLVICHPPTQKRNFVIRLDRVSRAHTFVMNPCTWIKSHVK